VEKEKGIIGQEIQMYRDDAGWRQFFGIIENLYPDHPISIDIAGTVESIAKITSEDLYTCYNTFYHPSNMILFVVGNLEPEQMMAFIRDNQEKKDFPIANPIKRKPIVEKKPLEKERAIKLNVIRPKFSLGFKGTDTLPKTGRALLEYKFSMSLLLQMLVGSTSKNYLKWYNEGLVDDTFDEEFNLDKNFHFADISGDSDEPEKAMDEVLAVILDFETSDEINERELALLKKRMLGKHLQSLNSLEFIANQFSQSLYDEVTLFDLIPIIEGITLEQVLEIGRAFFKKENVSRFTIYPS
jgi:predicted Zn-dependent peptidase